MLLREHTAIDLAFVTDVLNGREVKKCTCRNVLRSGAARFICIGSETNCKSHVQRLKLQNATNAKQQLRGVQGAKMENASH